MANSAGMPKLTGKRDDAQVRRDLKAAGYAGKKIVLLAPQDVPNQKAMTEIAADVMSRVGLNVDYQAVDWGTVVQRRANKGAPAQGGWNAFVTRFVGSEMFSPGVNAGLRCNGDQAWFGWPSSSRIEELRESWFDAPNLAAQRTLAERIQEQAFEDLPYYPLGLYYNPTAYRTDLTGVLDGGPFFWNVRRS
jgi:peptide/nickel transport system substrate-binding protein